MPLAFGTILGGMATLLTTANILASGLLRSSGAPGFGLLDFAPVGLPIVAVGTAYMALVGRRLLAARSMADQAAIDEGLRGSAGGDLVDLYRLSERLFQARVPPAHSSPVSGSPKAHSGKRTDSTSWPSSGVRRSFCLLHRCGAERGRRPGAGGQLEEFLRRDVEPYLEILPRRPWQERDLASASVVVVEAMLSPDRVSSAGHCASRVFARSTA